MIVVTILFALRSLGAGGNLVQRERLRYRLRRYVDYLFSAIDYLCWAAVNSHKRTKPLPEMHTVIVVASRSLGDVLVSTPVFRALRRKFARVDVLVMAGMQGALKGNPYVSRVVVAVDRDYDLGIILRSYDNNAISEVLRSRCKFLIGCTRVGIGNGTGRYLDRRPKPTFGTQLRTQDNLDVIRSIGLTGDDRIDAYTAYIPAIRDYVVLHAHGSILTHRWEKEKWIALACRIDLPVAFTGTDREYIDEITAGIHKPVSKAVGISIDEYFGWIRHAAGVVTVDTSAMHVAAAFATPTVALFGAGDPRIWRPSSSNCEVVLSGNCHSCRQRYCRLKDHRCMTSIEVQEVFERLRVAVQRVSPKLHV